MIIYYVVTRFGSRVASLGIGLLIAGVGVYYILRNTFGITMPQIDWDLVWPVIVLFIGLAILSHGLGLRGRDSGAATTPAGPAVPGAPAASAGDPRTAPEATLGG